MEKATILFLLGVLLAGVFLFARSRKAVASDERLIVERMGRYAGCRGPGLHVVVPFIDKATLVRLDEALPGWCGMNPEQVEQKLVEKHYAVR